MLCIIKITDPLDGSLMYSGHTSLKEARAHADNVLDRGFYADIRRASPGRQANGWAITPADEEDWARAREIKSK